MKRMSTKRKQRDREARPIREKLISKSRKCMICCHSPGRPWRNKPRELSQLCCHEIACGRNRQKALDQPYALLVLCWYCNGYVVTDKRTWPEVRQLAALKARSPKDYDLERYNRLVNPNAPNRITPEEVASYGEKHDTQHSQGRSRSCHP